MQENDDAELVASVAEEFVGKLGRDAVPYLRLEEVRAMDKGDVLSAEAWHDIADAPCHIYHIVVIVASGRTVKPGWAADSALNGARSSP